MAQKKIVTSYFHNDVIIFKLLSNLAL